MLWKCKPIKDSTIKLKQPTLPEFTLKFPAQSRGLVKTQIQTKTCQSKNQAVNINMQYSATFHLFYFNRQMTSRQLTNFFFKYLFFYFVKSS